MNGSFSIANCWITRGYRINWWSFRKLFCATCRVGLIHIQVLNFYQDISLFLLVIMWDKNKNKAPIFGNGGINTTIYHLRLVVWNIFYFAIYWLSYFSEGLKPPTRLYIYGDNWGTVNMALWTTHSPTFFWVGSRRASTRPMEATKSLRSGTSPSLIGKSMN